MTETANFPAPVSIRARTLAGIAITIGYAAFAIAAIEVPLGEGVVSPIWAPAGIALAGLVLYGRSLWPAIVVGSMVANVSNGIPPLAALGIGLGSAASASLAASLAARFRFDPAVDRPRDLLVLVPAALGSCTIAATTGVGMLVASGLLDASSFARNWLLWWSGDALGMLVAAPVLLVAATTWHRRTAIRPLAILEFATALAILAAMSAVVFSSDEWRRPSLLLPPWVWLTLRFRALGVSTGTLLLAGWSAWAAAHDFAAIPGTTPTQSVQVINALVLVAGLCLLAISTVLTERDAARAQLQQALVDEQAVARELRRLDEAKDRLLGAVSHELRTPLTSILALSTLLEDRGRELDEDKRTEMYERLSDESRRLDRLLTDLLDLERLRLGVLESQFDDVDVASVVRRVVDRHATSERPTSLLLEPVRIRVDVAKLERIVDNLVGNACKYTPLDARVHVRVTRMDDGALIVVDDQGSGVADADKVAIFEPFSRGSRTDSNAPGTGIGLSLVASFSELHGGRAWVEDRPGGGASFRVYLPAQATS